MKRVLVFLTTVLLLGVMATPSSLASAEPRRPSPGISVTAITQVADRQLDLTVRSAALGGREVNVRLLTPDGWDPNDRSQHWPTLWLLHGCCGDYTSWTAATDVAQMPQLRHVLVVMPQAGWNGWYSNWVGNGGDNDQQWQTFHMNELRPMLEKDFGAGNKRVIAGLSMGGQGTLMYAAKFPGMFRAAAAYSGSAHPLNSAESIARLQGFFSHEGNDPDNVWGDPVDDVLSWQQHDPYFLAKGLARIPVYLSCGDGTPGPFDTEGTFDALEADFYAQNVAVAARITEFGGTVTTNFYGAGQHKWAYWERELHASMPLLLGALRA